MGFWNNLGQGMLTGLGNGLVNAASGAVGSLLNNWINGSWRSQMRYQAKLNREQFDYQLAQMSPQALASRGLNPGLANSGSGSGMSASVGSVGTPSRGQLLMPNLSLSDVAQIGAINSKARLDQAEAKALEYDLERKKKQDAGGLAGYELSTAQFESETAKLTRDLVEQDIISRQLENRIKDVNARIAVATADITIAKSEWELEKLMSEVASIDWQNMYLKARGESAKDLIERQFSLMASQIGLFNSQSALYQQQAKTEEERTKLEKAMALIAQNDAFRSQLIRESFDMVTRDGQTVSMAFKDMLRQEITRLARNSDMDANYVSIVLDRLISSIGRMLGAGRQLFSIGKILEN